jgi:TonB family protein
MPMTHFSTPFLMWMALAAQDPQPDPRPLPPGWLQVGLSEGVELRYVPLQVTFEDYPKMALRREEEGTSVLSLQIDPSGQLLNCATARSSGSPDLDQQACQLYRERGRFQVRGTTEPVTIQAPVTWQLAD